MLLDSHNHSLSSCITIICFMLQMDPIVHPTIRSTNIITTIATTKEKNINIEWPSIFPRQFKRNYICPISHSALLELPVEDLACFLRIEEPRIFLGDLFDSDLFMMAEILAHMSSSSSIDNRRAGLRLPMVILVSGTFNGEGCIESESLEYIL